MAAYHSALSVVLRNYYRWVELEVIILHCFFLNHKAPSVIPQAIGYLACDG